MGPASVGVCLPRAWVNSRGLSVGATIHVRPLADGSVFLFDEQRQAPTLGSHFFVGAGAPPEHLFRRLLGAYLAGAQDFLVEERAGLRRETLAVTRSFCRRTLQPEVVSEEPTMIQLRDVIDESPAPLSRLVARMGQLVIEFHQEAAQGWTVVKPLPENYWTDRDDVVDRQAWFIERLAVRRLRTGAEPGEEAPLISPIGFWTVARSLERIADHAVVLGETGPLLAETSIPNDHLVAMQQFHGQALQHVAGALSVVARPNGELANDLLDGGEALLSVGRALTDRLLRTVSGRSTGVVTGAAVQRIIESIERTIAYAQDVAQVAIDRHISFPTPEVSSPPGFLPPTEYPRLSETLGPASS
ncbi:MAG: PhoU domain-containing protein [Thermoplasmata archaeon]